MQLSILDVEVLHTKRERANDKEKFLLELKVSVSKEEYLEKVKEFYDSFWDDPTVTRKEKQSYQKNPEEKFWEELKDVFLKQLLELENFEVEVKEKDSEEGKVLEAKILKELEKERVFEGYFSLIFFMPKTEIKKTLFGKKKIITALPNFVFIYSLEGEGNSEEISMIIERSKNLPVPNYLKDTFSNRERVILDVLKKKKEFMIATRVKVIPKYFSFDNKKLFNEKKQGLLAKLAFSDLMHKRIEESERHIILEIEDKRKNFDATIFLAQNDSYLPVFLCFDYKIKGKGQNYEAFLKDYWPSS